MSGSKLSVCSSQSILEGAATSAWLSAHGVEQERDSLAIDLEALKAGGVDVNALAEHVAAVGNGGQLTLELIQTFPNAFQGTSIFGEEGVEAAKERAEIGFSGAISTIQRTREALESAKADLDDIEANFDALGFDKFLDRLGTNSPVMRAAKTFGVATDQLTFTHGEHGLGTVFASTQAQRDEVWRSVEGVVSAVNEIVVALQKLSNRFAMSEDPGSGFFGQQAVSTVAQIVLQEFAGFAAEAVVFESADQAAREAQAAIDAIQEAEASQAEVPVSADPVVQARHAFATRYAAERDWPSDLGDLEMEQILEIRSQDGWKNPVLE